MNKWRERDIPTSTVTYDRREIEVSVGSIYKAINIIAKRSEQINTDIRVELLGKLEEFDIPNFDTLEEVFDNKEQIEISRYYENLPKPHSIALREWRNGEIYHRDASEEIEN